MSSNRVGWHCIHVGRQYVCIICGELKSYLGILKRGSDYTPNYNIQLDSALGWQRMYYLRYFPAGYPGIDLGRVGSTNRLRGLDHENERPNWHASSLWFSWVAIVAEGWKEKQRHRAGSRYSNLRSPRWDSFAHSPTSVFSLLW